MINLAPYNTYRIEAYARHVYFPKTTEEILRIYREHERVVMLGNGSNVILVKPYYEKEAFIVFPDKDADLFETDEGIYAQAGVLLKRLSAYACHRSLSGLETFFDIPASVGGAMIMNTGAYGDEIYRHVAWVEVLDLKQRKKVRFLKKEIRYGYRYSMFKTMNMVILAACFRLPVKEKAQIEAKMAAILHQRQAKLPVEPSAGSVFKRPDYSISVGEMVERMGLKGFSVGGAEISLKHGGVIVNRDKARGADILALIEYIKKAVRQHYQVELSLEQIVI